MIPISFHSLARLETIEAARYYRQLQPLLGKHFLAALRETINQIQSFPEIFREIGTGIRQGRVRRFPYGVIYRNHHDHIEIIAVMHLHRKPEYWQDRISDSP